ncbi:MAG: sulfotransferase [Chromatiales bacterium]|nr:sulfotransferase [Chromatiales bacterium]
MTTTPVLITLGDPPVRQALSRADAARLVNDLLQRRMHHPAVAVATEFAGQAIDDPVAQALAAWALYGIGELTASRSYIERSLALGNADPEALHLKSRICMELGDKDEALRAIEAVLQRHPDSSHYRCIHGQHLLKAGDISGARESLTRALELNPREIPAFATLSRLPGSAMPEHCRFVEFLLHSGQLKGDDEVRAHYALALQYEQAGDDAAQFRHLRAMNRKKRAMVAFDARRSREGTLRMIEHYSASYLGQVETQKAAAPGPIFVYGFPRSGTTLVEQILSGHPEVIAAGETSAFMQSAMAVAGPASNTDAMAAFIDIRRPEALAQLRQGYIARIPQLAAGSRITDKSPENFMYAGLIKAAFPTANLINVRRHPVATCYSCYKQIFFAGAIPYSYDLEDLVSRYTDYALISAHWDAVMPGVVHTVEYERLVSAPEDAIREILDHCGLPWAESCLRIGDNPRPVSTASSAQVRQGIRADSIDHWRRYEKYLQPLMRLIHPE